MASVEGFAITRCGITQLRSLPEVAAGLAGGSSLLRGGVYSTGDKSVDFVFFGDGSSCEARFVGEDAVGNYFDY